MPGPPLAVITGETRTVLVGAIIAALGYLLFATSSRRLVPTITAVAVGVAAMVAVVAFVGSSGGAGVFDRYLTIVPSRIVSSTDQSRGASFSVIPRLITGHPLGNGLGSTGPAAEFAGGGSGGSNGETEPGFLLSELGIPGLIVYYGLNLNLLLLGVARIRRLEPESRIFVAALLAGLLGILVMGISAATTATSPTAPYLWFPPRAGVLAVGAGGAAALIRQESSARPAGAARPGGGLSDGVTTGCAESAGPPPVTPGGRCVG